MPEISPETPAADARSIAGLTQRGTAAALGHTRIAIARAEARGDGITIRALRRLCTALGLELRLSVRRARQPGKSTGRGSISCSETLR